MHSQYSLVSRLTILKCGLEAESSLLTTGPLGNRVAEQDELVVWFVVVFDIFRSREPVGGHAGRLMIKLTVTFSRRIVGSYTGVGE